MRGTDVVFGVVVHLAVVVEVGGGREVRGRVSGVQVDHVDERRYDHGVAEAGHQTVPHRKAVHRRVVPVRVLVPV